jgi:tRNA dimethylallyltransferase
MSAIGYKSVIDSIEGKCTQDEMVARWVADELAYAKRQMTWFRKQPVIWYDVTYGNKKN